jgi:hypothetical protein
MFQLGYPRCCLVVALQSGHTTTAFAASSRQSLPLARTRTAGGGLRSHGALPLAGRCQGALDAWC